MGLPIDIGKVKSAATKIQNEIDVSINLNVYFDTTANLDFVSSIKEMFNDVGNDVSVKFIDISNNKLFLKHNPNLAIVIAGENPYSCLCYKALDINNIPCLMLSLDPQTLIENANDQDISIMARDVICPDITTYSKILYNDEEIIDFDTYNIAMDLNIKYQICNWFYDFAANYKIAYAAKFPFLRDIIADEIISHCAIQNAGIGALGIIPGADMPLMTLNQARMILELAAIYSYQIDEDRIIEIIVVVLSAFAMKYLSNYVTKTTGISKILVNGAFGFGGTQILGNIAKSYFASGLAIDGLAEKIKSATGAFAGMFLPANKL